MFHDLTHYPMAAGFSSVFLLAVSMTVQVGLLYCHGEESPVDIVCPIPVSHIFPSRIAHMDRD